MSLPEWRPPQRVVPSSEYKGEENFTVLHTAVGFALSEWEYLESGLIRLFQVLCESKTLAACRVYGSLTSSHARQEALLAATKVFFWERDENEHKIVEKLIREYGKTLQYRNYIAHGVTIQFSIPNVGYSGYFLCPAPYSSKRIELQSGNEVWILGADYFYRCIEIDHCRLRFNQLRDEAVQLAYGLNDKYGIIEPGLFTP